MSNVEVRVVRGPCWLGGAVVQTGDVVSLSQLGALESIECARAVLVDPADMTALRDARAREVRSQLREARRASSQPDDPHWR